MADIEQPPGGAGPPGNTTPVSSPVPPPPPGRSDNPSDNVVQRTRAWTGLWVVAGSDVAIVLAAIWGVVKISGTSASGQPVVAILTSAFTAIGTMTTAYFGIKSVSNTAQSFAQPTGPAAPSAGPAAPAATPAAPARAPRRSRRYRL